MESQSTLAEIMAKLEALTQTVTKLQAERKIPETEETPLWTIIVITLLIHPIPMPNIWKASRLMFQPLMNVMTHNFS